eukprot:GFUD01000027.1.p1 GENE.GFUD01000027.1~~GFUD01000027.1.p1  ORF type:complete len:382 (-),score=92.57 GFUD01000027.1:31-1176(-)
MMKSVRSVSSPNLKPVFALGGSVSGYTSMGSTDNIWATAGRDLFIWKAPEAVIDTHKDMVNNKKVFKSAFAKELEVKSFIEEKRSEKLPELGKCLSCNTSDLGSERRSLVDKEEQNLVLTKALEEFLRVRAENESRKTKMKTYNQRDERYKKLELEVEHLTWQLSKMEQSRLVYEDATHQLGSFLELVSSQLTGLHMRSDQPVDRASNPTREHNHSSSTTQQERCLTIANQRSSSISVTPLESKTRTGSVTHLTTGYVKSGHKGNNKSFPRKLRQQKNDVTEQPSRTRSIELGVTDAKESTLPDKKWSSETNLSKVKQKELFRRKTKLGRMVGKMKTCLRKEKRTGKFNVNKSTKQQEQRLPGPLSTTIIGFHGIWSLRNY